MLLLRLIQKNLFDGGGRGDTEKPTFSPLMMWSIFLYWAKLLWASGDFQDGDEDINVDISWCDFLIFLMFSQKVDCRSCILYLNKTITCQRTTNEKFHSMHWEFLYRTKSISKVQYSRLISWKQVYFPIWTFDHGKLYHQKINWCKMHC